MITSNAAMADQPGTCAFVSTSHLVVCRGSMYVVRALSSCQEPWPVSTAAGGFDEERDHSDSHDQPEKSVSDHSLSPHGRDAGVEADHGTLSHVDGEDAEKRDGILLLLYNVSLRAIAMGKLHGGLCLTFSIEEAGCDGFNKFSALPKPCWTETQAIIVAMTPMICEGISSALKLQYIRAVIYLRC